ncbi:MAG TPA: hypothetical protein VHV74_27105 [Pseudonocardiaceae bacterium]|nr:hypothetical protein [Pseudonocardiaceae bacterium]
MTRKPDYGERLRDTLGTPRWLRGLGSSPRSVVWTADIGSTPVVVKQATGGADAAVRFDREVTALRLAARADPPVAPRLLGTDDERHVLVLERLAGDPPGEDWVVRYAVALARLHSTTTEADAGALHRWEPPGERDVVAFLAFADRFEVAASPAVLDRLTALTAPAAGWALLHGDPCAGNDLYPGGGARLVDFEQASLGDGRVELAYARIGFPTCWCVTAPPPALLAEAEAAYWATLGTPPADLTDACAGWLIRGDALVEKAYRGTADHLAGATTRDWPWGTATARQRLLHRLAVVAALDDTEFGNCCAVLRERMLARWPGLRPLPADRTRAPIIRR